MLNISKCIFSFTFPLINRLNLDTPINTIAPTPILNDIFSKMSFSASYCPNLPYSLPLKNDTSEIKYLKADSISYNNYSITYILGIFILIKSRWKPQKHIRYSASNSQFYQQMYHQRQVKFTFTLKRNLSPTGKGQLGLKVNKILNILN